MDKGQFYFFTAIILSILLFSVTVNRISLQEYSSLLSDYYKNYMQEMPFVINSAIYDQADIGNRMENFTTAFINYALEKNIRLGIVSILATADNVRIVNYLNSPVKYIHQGISIIPPDSEIVVNRSSGFILSLEDNEYVFNLTGEPILFKALMRKE